MHPINKQAIVITGASSGAGRAAALEFAKYGPALILASRNEDILKQVAAECEELGAAVKVVVTDVTDPKSMINLANQANDWAGRIDVWINNAGVLAAGEFDHTPMEVHAQVIQTNLLGYLYGAHAALPFFKKQGSGILVNNISIGGFLPVPFGAGYTASKFGLRGFSEALKAELSGWKNIHICNLFSAFLDTPGIQHAGNYTGHALRPAPPLSDPFKVARAMVELASRPRSAKYVGSASRGLKLVHGVFPELMTKMTAGMMRGFFKTAPQLSPTNGNLFNTVEYGMSTNGGWRINVKPSRYKKYLTAALAAGILAGAAVIFFREK